MRIKAECVTRGRIPSERIALVMTDDGVGEQILVDESQTDGTYVYLPEVWVEPDRVLVELPQESASGCWRLWVPRNRTDLP